MHTSTSRIARLRRGFTLVELITAMAITAILVVLIMQLTSQSITLWKVMQEDTNSSATARMALQTMARDFESFQVRSGSNDYQWLYAEVDDSMRGLPKGLSIPKSARVIFFSCPGDRNPAVGAESASRSSYRDIIANNIDTQGDISTVAYRLLFRDQVLNKANVNGNTTMFPLFSLYRQVITPRETYDYILGRNDLKSAYSRYEGNEERNFLCENVVELSLVFNVEYADETTSTGEDRMTYKAITVPILATSARSGGQRFRLYSNRALTENRELANARIVSVELAITVLTEEGVALVEQVRLGQRKAPKLKEFFSRYTRSYSRTVALPIPL